MAPCLLPLLLFSASALPGKYGLKANNTHKFHRRGVHEKTERNLQQTRILYGVTLSIKMTHNQKIASRSKRQLWPWISVIWLYCLYRCYFSILDHIGLAVRLGCFSSPRSLFFLNLCFFVYFEVRSFYNPLGVFLYLFCIIWTFFFLFYLLPHVHINKTSILNIPESWVKSQSWN